MTRLVLRAALGIALALALALGGGWWFGRYQVLNHAEEAFAKGAEIGRRWLDVYRSTDGPPRRRARAARRALNRRAHPCRTNSVVPVRTSDNGQIVIGHRKNRPGLVLQLRHTAFPRNALCMPINRHPSSTRRVIVLGLAGILILAVLGGLLWPVTRRLRRIEAVVRQVAGGDLETQVADPTDDAIGSLGRAVDGMSLRIRELLAAQRHQTAATSHELRTPLARIAAADLLEEHPSPRLIDGIRSDVTELDALVGELLTLARLQDPAARDDLHPFDLVNIVADRLSAAERDERIEIHSNLGEGPATVKGSPALLARLLDNLLSNAGAHGAARVEVWLHRSDGEVQLVVDDDGPGIAIHDRERLMRPFERGGEARGSGGLGLAIAEQIARRHKGRLTIEDCPLGGARLRLCLPLLEADPAQHGA